MSSSKKINGICLAALALMILLTILFMNGERFGIIPVEDKDAETYKGNDYFTANDLNGSWDTGSAVRIALKGDSASVTGGGAYFDDGSLTIRNGGFYVISGELNGGSIIVDTHASSKVWIMLDNARVSAADQAALIVRQADKVFVTLAEGSDNVLMGPSEYSKSALEEKDNAVIWSKEDLTINGSGSLFVSGSYKHGIKCNDSLVIAGGTIRVTCPEDGIHANDSIHITEADISVSAGDDAIHCDESIYIGGGKITAVDCYEGIEAPDILIADGEILLRPLDDGINACSRRGEDAADISRQDASEEASDNASDADGAGDIAKSASCVHITGGSITILNDTGKKADGIDSNGDIVIDGGKILISLAGEKGTALDYGIENGGALYLNGGIVTAAGSSAKLQPASDESKQGSITVITKEIMPSDAVVTVTDAGGAVLLEQKLPERFTAVTITSPMLAVGETYTFTISDRYTQMITPDRITVVTGDGAVGYDKAAGRVSGFASASVSESAGALRSFGVAPFGGETGDSDLVLWWTAGGSSEGDTGEDAGKMRYLFLPADTDLKSAKLYFSADGTVKVDGSEVTSGQSASALTEGGHTVTCGGTDYPLTVCISRQIPAVFIATGSGSVDYIHENKENHESGVARIYDDGKLILDKDLSGIKIRGNTSTIGPKMSYTIRFKKKTDVFGMGKAAEWTLLANRLDLSLLHNDYAWELAGGMGLHYSSDHRYADLYINGNYMGNYCLCEKVEVGPDRVAIRDLERENEAANHGTDLDSLPVTGTGENGEVLPGTAKDSAMWVELPKEPEDVSGGYLLEFEMAGRYAEALCGFVAKNGQPVVISHPKHAGRRETEYIRSFVNEALEALDSPDGRNEAGKHYSEYFDLDSFVNMYILQELSGNIDAAQSSFYAVKDSGSDKLVFSPVWDLDLAFGAYVDRFEVNISDPEIWWAGAISYPEPTILTTAYRHEDFREAVRKRWAQLLEDNVIALAVNREHYRSQELSASGKMNVLRWTEGLTVEEAGERYSSAVERCEDFINARTKALTRGFSDQAALLYYDANGGSGYVYNRQIACQGETVILSDDVQEPNKILPPDESLHFAGWNTAPDGSGESYQAGEELMLNAPETVLYAMWQ